MEREIGRQRLEARKEGIQVRNEVRREGRQRFDFSFTPACCSTLGDVLVTVRLPKEYHLLDCIGGHVMDLVFIFSESMTGVGECTFCCPCRHRVAAKTVQWKVMSVRVSKGGRAVSPFCSFKASGRLIDGTVSHQLSSDQRRMGEA